MPAASIQDRLHRTRTQPFRTSRPPRGWPALKVLVIDDDFRNIFALTVLLERGHLEVVSAESGEEAIAVLQRTPDISLVLTDIMMPGMDGYETIRAIRKLPHCVDLPILAITANVAAGQRQLCIDAGASAYVPKPLDTAALLVVLGEWLPSASPVDAPTEALTLMADPCPHRRPVAAATRPVARAPRSSSSTTTPPSASRSGRCSRRWAIASSRSTPGARRCARSCASTFAVILMDVRMPTLDGYETAKLIRQRPQSELTPIIFITAFGGDEAETATAYASGAVDFIFTPILPDVLRAKVSAFVGLFVQSEELQRSLESITDLNAALRASEVRARAVLQNVADGIVTAGEGGLIDSFNRSAQALFGYREDEVIGQPLQLIVAPSHHDEFSESARAKWSLLNAKEIPAESTETVGCRKDGSCFPMEMGISQMQIGERTFTVACIRDISGRKAYTEALEHRALHDELTGLPNRTLFADRADRAIAFGDRADEPRAVLLVDLDRFGEINKTLGREKGDALLQAVAGRLRGAMRDPDTVGHLGGDSFGILPAGETDVGGGRGDRVEGPRGVRSPVPDHRRLRRGASEHRDRAVSRSTAARPPSCCAEPIWRWPRPSRPARAWPCSWRTQRIRQRVG